MTATTGEEGRPVAERELTFDGHTFTFTAEESTHLRVTIPESGQYSFQQIAVYLPAGTTLRLMKDEWDVIAYQDSGAALLVNTAVVPAYVFTTLPERK
jgi:hypothetical protein